MLRATNESLQIANREFASTHRPEIRLKHIWFSQDGQGPSENIWSDAELTVRLDIVNLGRATAYIDFIGIHTLLVPLGQRLPQRPPYDNPGAEQLRLRGFELRGGITFTQAMTDTKSH